MREQLEFTFSLDSNWAWKFLDSPMKSVFSLGSRPASVKGKLKFKHDPGETPVLNFIPMNTTLAGQALLRHYAVIGRQRK